MQDPVLALGKNLPADEAYRKITRRVVPFLFIAYVLSYLDRVNIGFAQLQMREQLQFNDTVYGFAASIFFVGYILFEVPSNLIFNKIGARKTLLRIMCCWGLVSMGTMFVKTPLQFYIARLLLGVFEAGLVPGMMLYLTYWYPPARRAAVTSLFLLGTVVAGIVGGPISGWILQNMNGLNGWQGWQWMFLLEGVPSFVLGVCAYLYMTDRPADARWLSQAEKDLVALELTRAAGSGASPERSLRKAFLDPVVFLLGFAQFTVLCGAYVLSFWLPSVIRGLGISSLQQIGFYSAIPSVLAVGATIFYSRHSDAHFERRWHYAAALLVASASLMATTMTNHSFTLSMVFFSLAMVSMICALPIFWTLASTVLSARASVAGLAIISSLANLAGVTAPYVIGVIKTATGSITIGIYLICALIVFGAIVVLLAVPRSASAVRPVRVTASAS